MNIGIIGGGAAGIMAALVAAEGGARVTIIEHMPRIGKKILLTGSGKCNISNVDMDLKHFHSNYPSVIKAIFNECPSFETLSFLKNLGLILKDRNGYLYPYSEQASTVLDVLRFALRDSNIDIITECNISNINYSDGFKLSTNKGKFRFDKLIIATGSAAYKNTGSDGSGYEIAKSFGHTITKLSSALTFLNCSEDFYPSIAGIRTRANVNIYANDDLIGEEGGELQITKTGISGIPVFNLSYLVSKYNCKADKIISVIDFLPDISIDDIRNIFKERIDKYPGRSLDELFVGILHKNLGNLIIKRSGYKLNLLFKDISLNDIDKIINMTKSFSTKIVSVGDFEHSQVLAGGVNMREINDNLESKLVKGLFFAGEILDVNGDCGGYNLTWAFSSGIVAGRNALK